MCKQASLVCLANVRSDGAHIEPFTSELRVTRPQSAASARVVSVPSVALTIESIAGTTAELSHRVNSAHLRGKGNANMKVDGAERLGEKLKLLFPQGSGFVSQQIRISWPK